MGNNIILSICIPTYNRAGYLKSTLLSIINQKRFQQTNDVEIIISDNCSNDETNQISLSFVKAFGEKIRYYRNTENISDRNFEKVLSLGKGIFLKLNNDTLVHHDNSLDEIIATVSQNAEDKNVIFFSNGTIKNMDKCLCKNLDSFIKTVSFYTTTIACFGIWKQDFDSIDGFSTNANLQLVQTDILFRLISLNRSVFVDNSKIFDSVSPSSKGGYNIYQVFITNYLKLVKKYRATKQVSWLTLFNEKTKLLIYFVIPWTIKIWRNKTKYAFYKKGATGIIFEEYKFHPILYIGFVYFIIKIMWAMSKELFRKIVKLA